MLAVLDYAIALLESVIAEAEALGVQVDAFARTQLAKLKALRDKIAAVVNPTVEPASLAKYAAASSSLSAVDQAEVDSVFEQACPE